MMKVRLFPIPLYGEGSADVESFPSYIHRISFEHGLYVGELIRFAYRHSIENLSSMGPCPNIPKYISVEEMVRPTNTVKMLISIFEEITRQSLKKSVLWFMDENVSRSTGEVVSGFRWCPECFREMELIGQEPYYKLIWHLSGINVCHTHRTPLLDNCPHCCFKQITYKKRYPIGYCQRCGTKLSKRKHRLKATDISHSWVLTGSDLVQLFHDLSKHPEDEIKLGGMRQSLDSMFDYYWAQEREADLYQVMGRDKLLAVIHGHRDISLKMARRFAYQMGLSLYDLFSGNAHLTSAVLNSSWMCELPPAFMLASKKEHHNHRDILRKVKKVLSTSESPPSLKRLVEIVGVSDGYLRHRHSVLVSNVVKDHKEYVDRIHLRKIYQAQSYALKYFLDEKYSNSYKSRKQAYRVLREETGLPKFILKRAIQNAYASLH